ncbi:flagellar biosynthesis protein FlgH [Sulfitobacter sp. HGT1]|uniref:flagellar biosynthesis protein FlgH n=1 Tax=Sulfitobacter sp. HGT1 TaxID=2735435 RepID=UPI0015945579|nr:flagellar biosynthesis protein FlgH [Sulfitobacter sp. HGT1]
MMKIMIIGALVLGMGAAGYFGEQFLRPTQAPVSEAAAVHKNELLFKMPLGNFTMQITQPSEVINMTINLDVYVMGAAAFAKINGANGRALLRDGAVAAIAEVATTNLGITVTDEEDVMKLDLSEQIVRKLYVNFPYVRTARINAIFMRKSVRK